MIIMVTKLKLLIVFACVAFTSGDVQGPPQPLPPTMTPNATSTTEVPPIPTTTNSTTTTTTPTTTTTTTPPSTTTPPTTPTTHPTTPTTPPTTPTTTTTTTTSTTLGPTTPTTTTSTTAEPITPAPVPVPDIGKWNVTDYQNNKTYILAEMAVQLNITCDVNNKTQYALLDIPKNASARGNFGNETQSLDITWFNKDNASNQFIMLFEKNDAINRYMIRNISISVTVTKEVCPDVRSNVTIILYSNKTEFSTPLNKSYRCAKKQTFDLMKDGSNKTFGAVTLSHVQLEAFHDKMGVLFDAAEDCERSSSPDIVPIAVGCALVGLVAIVLIAYLVGRRRSQARGYLSM